MDLEATSVASVTPLHQSGDLVFVHNRDLFGRLIRFAQKYDSDGPDSKWNHVGVLDEYIGGTWTIIQADTRRGVVDNALLSDIAPHGTLEIVPLPSSVSREVFLTAVRSKVGQKYGWLTIVSCAISAFFPKFPQFRRPKTLICSGLVATSLHYASFAPILVPDGLHWATPAQVLQAVQRPLESL